MSSIPAVPPAINEPTLSYAPGSAERTDLRNALERMAGEQPEIPLIIGGKEIRTGSTVRSLRDVPPSAAVLFDLTPIQLAYIAADELPSRYVRRLGRFHYGPGVFKVDYALDGPIPWRAAECARSATVHVGGTLEVTSGSRQGTTVEAVVPATWRPGTQP